MRESLGKLEYLGENYEEEWLRANFLPNQFRCASRVQAYHILASDEYRGSQGILATAEVLLKDPYLFKELKEERPAAHKKKTRLEVMLQDLDESKAKQEENKTMEDYSHRAYSQNELASMI